MEWFLLAVRLFLGGIFVISSVGKIIVPKMFVNNVLKYRVLPEPIAKLFGWILPYAELAAAVSLIFGWYVIYGSILILTMMAAFIIAQVIVIIRKEDISCSCFGLLYSERIGFPTIVRDFVLVGMSVYILFMENSSTSTIRLIEEGGSISLVVLAITALVSVGSLVLAVYSVKPYLFFRLLNRSS